MGGVYKTDDSMSNAEILESLGILGGIRRRLGVDAMSKERDGDVNALSADQVMREYAAWTLGDPSWWSDMKSIYDRLSKQTT